MNNATFNHPHNTAGCCDGHGVQWHNANDQPVDNALTYVTRCPVHAEVAVDEWLNSPGPEVRA